MRKNTHRPSGSMCKACEHLYRSPCAAIPFYAMPAMKTDADGTIVVKCTSFERRKPESDTWPEDVADWPQNPNIIQGGVVAECKCRRLGDYGSENYGHHPLCEDYVSAQQPAEKCSSGVPQNQVIAWAREAGMSEAQSSSPMSVALLTKFAALAAAAEREACAKLCDEEREKWSANGQADTRDFLLCAALIRSRAN